MGPGLINQLNWGWRTVFPRFSQCGQDCKLQWLAVTNSVDQTAALRRFCSLDPQLERRIRVIEISKLLAGGKPWKA
jgi:hypothetical protein